MRIAYWDCFSGIAGDMNLGAMVGCGLSVDDLRKDLAGLALDGYSIEHRKVERGALAADKIDVIISGEHGHTHDHEHAHDHKHGPDTHEHPQRGLADIRDILERSELPDGVAERADRVFVALCEAEASVHGTSVDQVQLHEVGAIDAIVDIVGACCGMRRLGIDAIRCSPLNVGGGQVSTAHGLLPVPAPATAYLLQGAPVYSAGPEVELVTPTGAALVATLAAGFGPWPYITVEAIGYGAGDNDFEDRPNVLRLVVGEAPDDGEPAGSGADGVSVIETNLDDASPELIGAVIGRLLEAGALDAFATPVFMKKNRPGTQLTVIGRTEQVDDLVDIVFRESTTLGLRVYPVDRRELEREHVGVETPWGPVRVKIGSRAGEVINAAPEFDDCEQLARQVGVPVKEVIQAAVAAYRGLTDAKEEGK